MAAEYVSQFKLHKAELEEHRVDNIPYRIGVHGAFVARVSESSIGDDVGSDRTLALCGRATTPLAGAYDPEHEITRDMREPTLFHEVRSVWGRRCRRGDPHGVGLHR